MKRNSAFSEDRLCFFTNAFSYTSRSANQLKWNDEMARFISSIGFPNVEISAKRHLDLDRVLSGGWREVRAVAVRNEIAIAALSYHANHLDADAAARKQNNEKLMKTIKCASHLGAEVVVTFSGMKFPFHYFYPYPENLLDYIEASWVDFYEVFGPIVDCAEDNNVTVAIEPHYGQLVFNGQTIDRMFKTIGSGNLAINLDPSNIVWQSMDPSAIIGKFGKRIKHLHAKDVLFSAEMMNLNGLLSTGKWNSAERSWRFSIPGKGVVDWSALFDSLERTNYTGVISFEHEDPSATLRTGSVEAFNYLRSVLRNRKKSSTLISGAHFRKFRMH